MLHDVQGDCEGNKMPLETLWPSVTSEGYMLLLPQNEVLVSVIQSEDPQHTKHDGEYWIFSLDIQEKVIKKLRKTHMMISTVVCKYITEVFSVPVHRHVDLDCSIRRKLYYFQALTVAKASELLGRVLLGDISGLGKKYQALAIASCFGDGRPILIVCSRVCKSTWQALSREILGMDIAVVGRISELRDGSSITDHTLIVKYFREFSSIEYGLVIVDDSHVFTNKGSYIAKCFTRMLKKVERVVLVTAAARYMSISEWFIVLSIIFRSRFITFRCFRKRYAEFPDELKYLVSRASLIRDRNSVLGGSLVIERNPSCAENSGRPDNMPPVHRRVIDCCSTRLKTPCVSLDRCSKEFRSRYKRETRHKHRMISTHLEYLLRKGLRVAVVVNFKSTIRALLNHAPATGQMILNGSCKEMDELQCTKFNTGDVPAVIATYKALKTCPFLRVDTVCIAELHLKTEYVSRAESVSGHTVMADVHYLVERGGVERCLWEAIRGKLEM